MLIVLGGIYLGTHLAPPQPTSPRSTVPRALNEAEDEGYARARTPRAFSFPADHGPHPMFRTEWWYFTGNLTDPQERPFGFELTFFRIALSPTRAASESAWRTQQLYMAHLALTDVAAKQFHAYERFSREALGLAGAKTDTLHVWLEDWSIEPQDPSGFPLRLRAAENNIALDLTLNPGKPPVLQGDRGLSQKSGEPGNASYYYSITRIPTSGLIRIDNQDLEVKGDSWLDREWSTGALGPDQVGWDWFALQLSDQREIMFFRMRQHDGKPSPFSAGSLIDAQGEVLRLNHKEVVIEVLDQWASPTDGALYPARWRFKIPQEALDLDIQPLLANQELNISVRYWEGAVRIRGTAAGLPIEGRGYVELTGYAAPRK
jgi:predicted secreted hydrolase